MGGAGYGNHGEAAEPKGASGARKEAESGGGLPPAGPHADPSLVNNDLTPGAGTLPDVNKGDGDVDTASA